MTDVLHLKAKKHGVEIWKSDWKSKNSWLNGFHLCLVCTKVVKMWKRSKKLTQTVSSAILQLGTTDSPLFWWRTCCIETRMHMTWDITHFHFWVFQVFYPSNQLQTIRFCVKKTRWSGFFQVLNMTSWLLCGGYALISNQLIIHLRTSPELIREMSWFLLLGLN